jgi:nucleoside-diphosphate-sugar epimerase
MDGSRVMTNHLLCIGMGYSARALARQLAAKGWRVTGSSTSDAGTLRVRAEGWNAARFDGSSNGGEAMDQAIANTTHLVVSAAPGESGDPVLRQLASALARAPKLSWIGYLSTVGVYGDHQGAWVDEDTPVSPTSVRSRQRVAAENAWLDFANSSGRRVQIFRLSGIYGPGRSAIDNLRAGTARRIIKPGQVFNRIHVDDIAGALAAAIAKPESKHTVYNLTDDEPAPPQDVVEYAAKLLGLPVPPDIPFAEAPLSPMGLSFYGENKRVANQRIKADLGYAWRYPTYREGMSAIVAAVS